LGVFPKNGGQGRVREDTTSASSAERKRATKRHGAGGRMGRSTTKFGKNPDYNALLEKKTTGGGGGRWEERKKQGGQTTRGTAPTA